MIPGGHFTQRIGLLEVQQQQDAILGRTKPQYAEVARMFARKVPTPSAVAFFADEQGLLEACDFWLDNQGTVKVTIAHQIKTADGLVYEIAGAHDFGTHVLVNAVRRKTA
jgi:hypothetical protein